MTTTCRRCGAALPDGIAQCPSCLTVVRPPGFLQRLFAAFSSKSRASGSGAKSSVRIQATVKRVYKFRDAATGEMKEYRSLDEMPAQYRVKLEKTLANAQARKSTTLSITGPDGVARTYGSMDDVPADVRALIDKARKE